MPTYYGLSDDELAVVKAMRAAEKEGKMPFDYHTPGIANPIVYRDEVPAIAERPKTVTIPQDEYLHLCQCRTELQQQRDARRVVAFQEAMV